VSFRGERDRLWVGGEAVIVRREVLEQLLLLFFFSTLATGPRRSLSLMLRIYEP